MHNRSINPMERILQPTPSLTAAPLPPGATPQAALATCQKLLAQARAKRFSGITKSTNATSYTARRNAEGMITRAEAEIRRLQAEARRLEVEAGVASLQADLVQHFPGAIKPTHYVPARYPEAQR